MLYPKEDKKEKKLLYSVTNLFLNKKLLSTKFI